ncbi:primosomal protein N' [Balneolales bacterium ANBcel1]|nr:primosomal protein N' [Balneolales bacterium ANBcel1]
MSRYADIAFHAAIRQCFTYRIPDRPARMETGHPPTRNSDERADQNGEDIQPGMRVWVPLKNQMAVGMVVKVHSNRPDFETRDIVRVLDSEPVLSPDLLKLTEWVHRFYYSGFGEAIQAALPAGMNFLTEPKIRKTDSRHKVPSRGIERDVYDEICNHPDNTDIPYEDLSRRWGKKGERAIERLVRKGLIEIWQIPRLRMTPRTVTVWSWTDDTRDPLSAMASPDENTSEPGKKTPKWVHGVRILKDLPLPATRKEILEHPEITPYVWKRIQDSGLVESREVAADRLPAKLPFNPNAISRLNQEQQTVFEPVKQAISDRVFKRFLLYGITGSGKTEIYIHALRETLRQGRGGLILVPEIALTPQTVRRFHLVFGDQVAVLHSRLSERERYDAWTSLQKGEKKVAIGPRSAVFAPVRDPGLIIIDEEHDPSYKQEDPAPRYHARETAVMRAWYNRAVILTGSATPSLVSLQVAAGEKASMIRLDNRHALAELPEVAILDLKQYRQAMRGPLAVPLYLAVEEALQRREQVILLHNRRGFSTFIQCEDCGEVLECPHCSVSLTYHKPKRHLRCHYCGYSRLMPRTCPSCDSEAVGELGTGTQKVEAELEELFPDARMLRMDQDTTSGKNAHDTILQKFGRGDADILMGTQIVAKGLDFPNVTVVGVINSDTELAFPSYRSSERMYQLISQVAGRSGRGSKPGKVFLQTLMPDHPALQFAKNHDFPGFARNEMKSRQELGYPPYSRLVKIFFRSDDAQIVADVANLFTEITLRFVDAERVMGPSPSTITRMKRRFSWESHIKLAPDKTAGYIESLFDTLFREYDRVKPGNSGRVRITVNVDTMH